MMNIVAFKVSVTARMVWGLGNQLRVAWRRIGVFYEIIRHIILYYMYLISWWWWWGWFG